VWQRSVTKYSTGKKGFPVAANYLATKEGVLKLSTSYKNTRHQQGQRKNSQSGQRKNPIVLPTTVSGRGRTQADMI
jgi:hypothetical protein